MFIIGILNVGKTGGCVHGNTGNWMKSARGTSKCTKCVLCIAEYYRFSKSLSANQPVKEINAFSKVTT